VGVNDVDLKNEEFKCGRRVDDVANFFKKQTQNNCMHECKDEIDIKIAAKNLNKHTKTEHGR